MTNTPQPPIPNTEEDAFQAHCRAANIDASEKDSHYAYYIARAAWTQALAWSRRAQPSPDPDAVESVYKAITPLIAAHDNTYAGCREIAEAAVAAMPAHTTPDRGLIEKLEEARRSAIDAAIATIRQHQAEQQNMGGVEAGRGESLTGSSPIGPKGDNLAPPAPSEIPDTDMAKLRWIIASTLEGGIPFPNLPNPKIEGVLESIRPYLRTTEPVSVSLEKCYAAFKTERSLLYMPDGTTVEDIDWKKGIRAVLDAAGVKYE